MAELEYQQKNNIGIISIGGRFTLVDKDDFQKLVKEEIDLSGMDVILDVTDLEYVDSSGIGDFIKLKMEAAKYKNSVFVKGIRDHVEQTFKSARLDSVFTLISEEEFIAKTS